VSKRRLTGLARGVDTASVRAKKGPADPPEPSGSGQAELEAAGQTVWHRAAAFGQLRAAIATAGVMTRHTNWFG
jgi:hypothetical protein